MELKKVKPGCLYLIKRGTQMAVVGRCMDNALKNGRPIRLHHQAKTMARFTDYGGKRTIYATARDILSLVEERTS